MPDNKFLTAEEVSERYRGEITVGTLRNWRRCESTAFVKIERRSLSVTELDAWIKKYRDLPCLKVASHDERDGA